MCIYPDSNDSDKQQHQVTLNQLCSFRSIINDSFANMYNELTITLKALLSNIQSRNAFFE
ncbi:9261_t:CDS:2 [Entrophospora sp. SA101]|nr:9261_t:CDS:2 [Entrophospora sp. SA101]